MRIEKVFKVVIIELVLIPCISLTENFHEHTFRLGSREATCGGGGEVRGA